MPDPTPEHPNAGVRMRGFAERTTVERALAWVDSVLPAFGDLGVQEVGLMEAAGRVLARDVSSRFEIPRFARSMMDGFAVRGEDTYGATSYNPLPLLILGTGFPGEPSPASVAAGEAVRIMTGAPLPQGADAVVPAENTQLDGANVLVLDQVSAGKNVGQAGEDISTGDVVASAGRVLRPQDIGVLSSIGCARVAVIRRPRVRIIVTGNELLPAGTPPQGFRIADANGPMLAALAARDGGQVTVAGIVPDDPERIREELLREAEVVLVSGGSSVGQEDYVPRLLAEQGELAVHGIAMRPSSPTGMGRMAGRIVFLLPGNPVSCLCAYDFFAGRAIRAFGGRSKDWPYRRLRACLTRKLVSAVGRVDYARVLVRGREVEPLAVSGASILSSTTRADGFVIVPADSEGFPTGAEVEVMMYE